VGLGVAKEGGTSPPLQDLLGMQVAIMKLSNIACILYNIATRGDGQQGLSVVDRHKVIYNDLLNCLVKILLCPGRFQVRMTHVA
jgi:hypothetical protein